LEQDDMPSENSSDERAAPEPKPKPVNDTRPPPRPAPQNGPPILNDGPELLRSSHC
jgi:hypothetical protein